MPGLRAGTRSPPCAVTQRCQSGHQDPETSVAPLNHSSGSGGKLLVHPMAVLAAVGRVDHTGDMARLAASTKRTGPL